MIEILRRNPKKESNKERKNRTRREPLIKESEPEKTDVKFDEILVQLFFLRSYSCETSCLLLLRIAREKHALIPLMSLTFWSAQPAVQHKLIVGMCFESTLLVIDGIYFVGD